jgi:hypothetical protein
MVGANIARRRVLRAIFILLLLTFFAGVQTASAITEQVHHHDGPSHTDCCGVCHAGHLSVTPAIAGFMLVLPDVQCWHKAQDAPPAPGEFVASLHLSRAPPRLHS